MSRKLAILALLATLPSESSATCVSSELPSSLADVVSRVEAEELGYVFIGERHGIGPIKRFAVDLANSLVDKGYAVGLFVEGFRTDCAPGDGACWSLARAFNPDAFQLLLDESRATVHPIDPPQRDDRAARMGATIAEASESISVVLVGRSHVIHAGDPDAEHRVYGGRLRYPRPGDLARLFPRHEYLTIGLATMEGNLAPYSLRENGCELDYVVTTEPTGKYWGSMSARAGGADSEDPTTEKVSDVAPVPATP